MVLYIRCALGLLAFLLFSSQVSAVTTKPWRATSYSGGAAGTMYPEVTYETMKGTFERAMYTTRATPISPASMAKMAKGAIGGPVGAAVTAAAIAYDLIVDQNTGEIIKTDEPSSPNGSYYQVAGGRTYTASHTRLSSCAIFIASEHPTATSYWIEGGNCRFNKPGLGTLSIGVSLTSGACINGMQGYPDGTCYAPENAPSGPASDQDITDAVSNYTPNPNLWVDVANDTITGGRWRDDWPEAGQTADDISDTLGQDVDGTPAQNYDPTITDSTTVAPPPTITTTNNNTETAAEWPLFCEWATVVCDFIDWFKFDESFPEDPALPYIPLDIDDADYNSGLPSNGVCPSPHQLSLLFGAASFEVSYEPFCNLATAARPLVLIAAYLLAAYILVGSIRR